MKPKLVVCASGEGSNFEAIVSATRAGRLNAEVAGLITNRPNIGAIGRARLLGIPFKVINPKSFGQARSEWDKAMAAQILGWSGDWVVLAGFLALIGPEMLNKFPHRIV